MTHHKWILSDLSDLLLPTNNMTERADGCRADGSKYFICGRCGIGPILKNFLEPKSSIVRKAKAMGHSSDCNVEIVGKIHES